MAKAGGGTIPPLQSADLEAHGLKGRILWADGTPAPGLERADGSREPAYILIHGIGVSHRYLRRLHGELAATAPTYSLDLPGFAGTPRPGRQLSVEDYGAFIAQALKASGIGPYILVGHSMGVQFAIEAALCAPDHALRLVLMGPVVDSRHRSVGRQGLALFLDSLLRESASSNWLVVSDYFRCGPRWYFTVLPVMWATPRSCGWRASMCRCWSCAGNRTRWRARIGRASSPRWCRRDALLRSTGQDTWPSTCGHGR